MLQPQEERNFYYDSADAVLTYKINKKEVGIIINKAVAINPRIFTSIFRDLKFLEIKKNSKMFLNW